MKLTKKLFREFLNRDSDKWAKERNEAGHSKWSNHRLGNRRRPYGDYLYAQDPEMFNMHFEMWKRDRVSYEAGTF